MAAKLESMRAHLIGNLWKDIETFVDEKITAAFATSGPCLAPVEPTPIATPSATFTESTPIDTPATPAELTPIDTPSATPAESAPIDTPSATPAEPTLIYTPSGAAAPVDQLPQQQDDVHEQWLRRREWQQQQFLSKQKAHMRSTIPQELLCTTSPQTENAKTEGNAVAETSYQMGEMHVLATKNTPPESSAQVGWEQHEHEVRRMLQLESAPPCPEEAQSLVAEIKLPDPIERMEAAAHIRTVSEAQMTTSLYAGRLGLLNKTITFIYDHSEVLISLAHHSGFSISQATHN